MPPAHELLVFALHGVVDRGTVTTWYRCCDLSGREGTVRVVEQLVPLGVERRLVAVPPS